LVYINFPVLVFCTTKNLATLVSTAFAAPFLLLENSHAQQGGCSVTRFGEFSPLGQGDQIERIFAQWEIVYFGQLLENYISWATLFHG
jgi:hypothetical protein